MSKDNLESRHQSEIDFHDKKYSQAKRETIYDFGFINIISDEMFESLGDLTNKKVVDFGCGSGWVTEILLNKGAEVWAFDISEEAVKKTSKVAEKMNLSDRIHLDVMPAEKLKYEDDFFDAIVGVAILHHLDLDKATKEIRRVLKSGGKAYFMEPLGHNIFVNLYRDKTPDIRSPDETPLSYTALNFINNRFSKFEHKNYYLLTLFSLIWFYLFKNKTLLLKTRNILYKVDRLLLSMVPSLRKFCWYTVMIMQK